MLPAVNSRTRRTAGIAMLALIAELAAIGCGPKKSTAYDTPLSEASGTPSPPAGTRPAGPPVIAACALLTADEVAAGLGLTAPTADEDESLPNVKSCHYQAGNGYLIIYVSTVAASGTADQAVNHALVSYHGTLDQVPGLGDAGIVLTAGTVDSVIFALAEADQMRTVTMDAFSSAGLVNKDGLLELAHTLAGRL
jgi:hypothetical protein